MARRAVTRDLTHGSPLKLLVSFTLPLLSGFLFQQLYSFVDTAIVGRYLGYDALAAVGSTGSINFLVNGFCMGLCSGFAIPIAQSFGAKDETELRRFVFHAAFLAGVLAVLMAVVTGLLSPALLRLMNTPEELLPMAVSYIQPIFCAIPAMVLYNMTAGVMRSLGDGRTPMLAIVIAALINIVLDLLFILVLDLHVMGAALATIISQLVSGLWCLSVLVRKFHVLRMTREDCRLRAPFIRRLLNMGVPFGLQYSITAIGSITVTVAMNGLGAVAMAVSTAAGKMSVLLNTVIDALASAMATFTGQNVGAKKLDRVHQGLRAAGMVGSIYCVIAFVAVLTVGREALSMFVDGQDPEIVNSVLDKAHQFLTVNSALYIPLLFVNIVRFTIQGMGYTKVAMVAGVMELVGRAAVAFLLVPLGGFAAICWANPVAWIMADLFLFPCYFSAMRRLRLRMYPAGTIPEAA